jgi:hypothetical protein
VRRPGIEEWVAGGQSSPKRGTDGSGGFDSVECDCAPEAEADNKSPGRRGGGRSVLRLGGNHSNERGGKGGSRAVYSLKCGELV